MHNEDATVFDLDISQTLSFNFANRFNENIEESVENNDFSVPKMYESDDKEDGKAYSSADENEDQLSFRNKLCECLIDMDINHNNGNKLLHLLRSHECFSYLPRDIRTLLQTPRDNIPISDIGVGQYLHLGFERALETILLRTPAVSELDLIEIDIGTYGVRADNSRQTQLWPIQCMISNVRNSSPEVIGIYRGSNKPDVAMNFFSQFLSEYSALKEKGGITYEGRVIPFKVRAFIADAPARSFVLNHKGHMAKYPCSKCTVKGSACEGQNNIVYTSTEVAPRTHEDYLVRSAADEHFHPGTRPAEIFLDDIVTQTPFEYRHLVLLGIMKKLLSAWMEGKFNLHQKLDWSRKNIISQRLDILASYCPKNFSRGPRSIQYYGQFKATEHRLFLIYTGIVVLFGVIDGPSYLNFLMFHVAIRTLTKKDLTEVDFRFAEAAIVEFISSAINVYGEKFASYNLHALKHLTEDARRFGNVDKFSAFPFENNMAFFRKATGKADKQLQQIYRRFQERIHFRSRVVEEKKKEIVAS